MIVVVDYQENLSTLKTWDTNGPFWKEPSDISYTKIEM